MNSRWYTASLTTLGAALTSLRLVAIDAPTFQQAAPVWVPGREQEKNLTLGWRAAISRPASGRATLRLTASTLYRAFINGHFAGHGPARAGHGFYRVDEWDLGPQLEAGTNWVAVEVAAYNVNSYDLLDQPAFLQAEVVDDAGRVLAATGDGSAGFEARAITERRQKVQRYSFQRPFSEVWRLAPDWDAWRTGEGRHPRLKVSPVDSKRLLGRGVPYPRFALRAPVAIVGRGRMQPGPLPNQPWKDRALTQIGPKLGGFPEAELETIPSLEFQAWKTVTSEASTPPSPWPPTDPLSLSAGGYCTADLGINLSGFLGVELEVHTSARVFVAFDEILREGEVDWKRLGCVNLIVLELEPGRYRFESFEPYTLRFAKVIALTGEVTLRDLWLRELANPDVDAAHFACSDPRLNRLFEAGRETFRQNAVDIFMDCPSRERAGWLCDSFFTARTEFRLCGASPVERNFLENFAQPAAFAFLPEGMLPMCYPADHNDGIFIPNWSLWFVLQLEEYEARTGDRSLIDALRPRVMRLLDFFRALQNAEGLLEKLPSWVFVEWSRANEWVQDVNFPSNMLYARALVAAGRLYDAPGLTAEAERLREGIRRLAFDGEFFVDNAVRRNGRLEVTRNRSEVCQYFAFFFEVATPASHPDLWRVLRDDFGPRRRQTQAHPEVAPANAFVGNVLRLEILSRYARCQQTLDESVDYLLYMAEKTGTLWENDGDYASCNHGFASHVIHVLDRDVLGLAEVDPVQRQIRLRFSDLRLDWCEGALPVPGGRVSLQWRKTGPGFYRYRLEYPAGYALTVETPPGVSWEREY